MPISPNSVLLTSDKPPQFPINFGIKFSLNDFSLVLNKGLLDLNQT